VGLLIVGAGVAIVVSGSGRNRPSDRPLSADPGQLGLDPVAAAGSSSSARDPAAIPGGAGAVPVGTVVRPESFGAVGDGKADDTAALQRAFDSLDGGKTLVIEAGRTYRHTAVLKLGKFGSRVMGPGTILATAEEKSAIWIEADNVTLYGGLVLKMSSASQRWHGYDQVKLRLSGHSGAVVDSVVIDGSAAAGIFVGNGAHQFTITNVTVRNTGADGIQMTDGAHDGIVTRPKVSGAGDDGVAVMSYLNDPERCRNITVDSPVVESNVWGRGVAVVGGEDITYRNISVARSTSAAVYIAAEGAPFNSTGSRRIRVLGGTVTDSNTRADVGHGAVVVYSGHPGQSIDDVQIDGLRISNTRVSAPSHVSVRGAPVNAIRLTNLAISGTGPPTVAAFVNGAEATVSGWTVDGKAFTPN